MVQTYHAQEVSAYSDAAESDEGSWYAGPESDDLILVCPNSGHLVDNRILSSAQCPQ